MDNSYRYIHLGPQLAPDQFEEIKKAAEEGMVLDALEGKLVARKETASDQFIVSTEAQKVLESLKNLSAPVSGLSQRKFVVLPSEDFPKLQEILDSSSNSSSNSNFIGSFFSNVGSFISGLSSRFTSSSTEAVVKEPLYQVLSLDEARRETDTSISDFIAAHKTEWMRAAAENRHKMHLVRVGENHPLHGMAKAFLVKEDGTVYIRHFAAQQLGQGTYKRIYRATIHGDLSRKTYAWSVLKERVSLEQVQTSASIIAFKRVIEGHPAFNQVGEFVDFEEGQEVVSQGEREGVISLSEAYDGDALTLRNQTKKPVLHGEGIVKLAEGLAFIHGRGFIHGDIKLENILVKDGDPVWHDFDMAGNVAEGKLPLRCTILAPEMRNMVNRIYADEKGDASLFPKIDVYVFACSLKLDLSGSRRHYRPVNDMLDDHQKWLAKRSLAEKNLYQRLDDDPVQVFTPEEREGLERLFQLFEQEMATREQAQHLGKKPQPGIPHYEYEYLLWEGMNPNPAERPDSAQFADRLRQLLVDGKLP